MRRNSGSGAMHMVRYVFRKGSHLVVDASSAGPIVVLTGAGVSAESGLPTFRGAGGLWEGHRVEEVATPGAFARDPDLVHRFYNERRAQLQDPRDRAQRGASGAGASSSAAGRASFCWSRRTSTTCTSGRAAGVWSTCTAS